MLAFHVGAREQPTKPVITFDIPAQQHQPMRLVQVGRIVQPYIRPDNGLHPCLTSRLIKFDCPKKIGEIRQRHRRHVKMGGSFDQIISTDDAVREGKFRVYAQMDERSAHAGISP